MWERFVVCSVEYFNMLFYILIDVLIDILEELDLIYLRVIGF